MQNQQEQSNINLPWMVRKTAEQSYVGVTGGMYTITYIRELGGCLGQTSLLRKDFSIKGIIGNLDRKTE